MGIFIPHMKSLCPTLWLGEVCTDENAGDYDAQSMIV